MNGRPYAVYLDVCCLNRPFDDRSQPRVDIEAAAIVKFFQGCKLGFWTFAGSDAIETELSRISDLDKLDKAWEHYSTHGLYLEENDAVIERSVEFLHSGLRPFDSLHLALAEIHGLDAFLTTDDAFLKTAKRIGAKIPVSNPVPWVKENFHYVH